MEEMILLLLLNCWQQRAVLMKILSYHKVYYEIIRISVCDSSWVIYRPFSSGDKAGRISPLINWYREVILLTWSINQLTRPMEMTWLDRLEALGFFKQLLILQVLQIVKRFEVRKLSRFNSSWNVVTFDCCLHIRAEVLALIEDSDSIFIWIKPATKED